MATETHQITLPADLFDQIDQTASDHAISSDDVISDILWRYYNGVLRRVDGEALEYAEETPRTGGFFIPHKTIPLFNSRPTKNSSTTKPRPREAKTPWGFSVPATPKPKGVSMHIWNYCKHPGCLLPRVSNGLCGDTTCQIHQKKAITPCTGSPLRMNRLLSRPQKRKSPTGSKSIHVRQTAP